MRHLVKNPSRGGAAKPCGEGPSTEAMMIRLKSAQSLNTFIDEHQGAFFSGTICQYFDQLLDAYGVSKADAIERSNIERGFGYQILRGAKGASRDKYIRLAIGIGLNLEETQRLLTVAQHGILYCKVLRDAILIFGITNRLNILAIGCLLEEKGAEPLE